MPTSPCPSCGHPRPIGKYLCRPCWFTLTHDTRDRLNQRGAGAGQRLLSLRAQIRDGVPLPEVRIE